MSAHTLNMTDVIDIRRSHANGTSSGILASSYGVDSRTIRKIVSGERWSSIPQDRIIKSHPNYAVTADGRVWSFAKNDYLTVKTVNGEAHVRLSKTKKDGTRVQVRKSVSKLVKTYFG